MKTYLPYGLLGAALLLSTGSAVYYKSRASDFETRWTQTMTQLKTALRTPKQFRPAETPLPERTAPRTPAEPADELITLRAQLQEKDNLIARLNSQTNRSDRANGPRSPEDMQARMEELKKTDPKQYEEMMARREEFRQNIQNAFSQKAATLLDRDTSNLSKDEMEQYQNMLNLMNETWQLTEKMTAPDTTSEERREIRQTLTEKTEELRPLLQDERNQRFVELGIASGYTAEEAKSFAKYINDTISATSLPGGHGIRRPSSGPPPTQ